MKSSVAITLATIFLLYILVANSSYKSRLLYMRVTCGYIGQSRNTQHVQSSVGDMETESLNRPNVITEDLITEEEVRSIYKTLKESTWNRWNNQ